VTAGQLSKCCKSILPHDAVLAWYIGWARTLSLEMNKVVSQTLAHAACPNVSEGLRHRLLKTAYHEVMLPASKKVVICDGYECSTVRSSVHVASEIVTYEYGTLTVSVLSVSAINVDPRVADLTVCESLKCSLRHVVCQYWCTNKPTNLSQSTEYNVVTANSKGLLVSFSLQFVH